VKDLRGRLPLHIVMARSDEVPPPHKEKERQEIKIGLR